MTKAGEPESADPADQDHWRARRLRKNIDDRRRQRAKGELVLVGGKNADKKHARDATSLRALQVTKAVPSYRYAVYAHSCHRLGIALPKACVLSFSSWVLVTFW